MEWRDSGLVIGAKRHGETSVILELMTAEHGRVHGFVRGGRSRRMQPALQAGNEVALVWRARLDEHMGALTVEATLMRTAELLASEAALQGVTALCHLLRHLPEREPHPALYAAAILICGHLRQPALACALMARFELALLQDLGFGLDLTACAATGATQDLAYVSPKSGRAVSAAAGAPYHDRLLPLPAFLLDGWAGEAPAPADVAAAARLTGYFLARDLFEPRGQAMPLARERFLRLAGV